MLRSLIRRGLAVADDFFHRIKSLQPLWLRGDFLKLFEFGESGVVSDQFCDTIADILPRHCECGLSGFRPMSAASRKEQGKCQQSKIELHLKDPGTWCGDTISFQEFDSALVASCQPRFDSLLR